MEQFTAYSITIIVIIAVVWFSIKTAMSEARRSGAAEAVRDASEAARQAEDEMNQIQAETITDQELRDRARNRTFGGQKP